MSDLPGTARAVVIGGGIVGNSLAGWLAELGWRDLVLLDKGPFPNPGGSTGHASNFIYPVDHSKEMTQLTLESMRQYREAGVFIESGGLEVARTEERLEEFRRRMASAKSWGVDGVSLVTPAQVKELVPYIDESVILGGFYSPSVGVVDSLRFGTIMRERAQELGALQVFPNTEVLGIDVENGRVKRVLHRPRRRRHRGRRDRVRRLEPAHRADGRRVDPAHAGGAPDDRRRPRAPLPRARRRRSSSRSCATWTRTCTSARTGRGSRWARTRTGRSCTSRTRSRRSRRRRSARPSCRSRRRTSSCQLEHALQLVPEILGDEAVGIKYAINGLLSLTPDGLPLLGETPEVKGLWSAAAVWVKEGPGVGKSLAEWMMHGESEIDLQSSDIARFYDEQRTPQHVKGRAAEGFNKTYGIVHPSEQWESNRRVRMSPFYAREQELGARFFEAAAWERPQWYESNAKLVEEYGVQSREHEWDARWWSPIINAEHLAMRDRAAMFDLTAFCIFDVVGPGALDVVQQVAARQMNVPNGRVIYTPVLSPRGTFKSDLTIMRMDDEIFRVVTGGAHGMADKKWFADHLNDGARIDDLTSTWCTVGLWGPRARDILASITRRRRLERGLSVQHVEDARGRRVRRPRLADLVRRRPGLGAVRADGERREAVGRGVGGGAAARRRPGRHRRLRHDGPAREVLPRLRHRARRGLRRRRGRHGVVEGEGRGLRRQGGARRAPRVRAGGEALHAHVDDQTSKSGIKRYPLGREPIVAARRHAARPTRRAAART